MTMEFLDILGAVFATAMGLFVIVYVSSSSFIAWTKTFDDLVIYHYKWVKSLLWFATRKMTLKEYKSKMYPSRGGLPPETILNIWRVAGIVLLVFLGLIVYIAIR